ncbi:hypothetical protein N7V09_05265 [Shewanella seohaensis]|nr:hypothetical protein N7V09_05265 [Shewanella seohaensis]
MRKTFRQPHALAALVVAILMGQLSGCATTSAQTSPTEYAATMPDAQGNSEETAQPQHVETEVIDERYADVWEKSNTPAPLMYMTMPKSANSVTFSMISKSL